MSHLLQLHKPATANNRYRGLQQWFRWMASEDEIEYSPFAKLSPPTVPEEPVPVVPIDAIRAVLATCRARTFVNLRDEAIIRLFCDTGVRVSEMAGLLRETGRDQLVPHLDLEQQLIWVLGKGHRFRAVPFGPKTGLSVDRYIRPPLTSAYAVRGAFAGRRRPLCVRGCRVSGALRPTDGHGPAHGRARTSPRTGAEKATDGAGRSGYADRPARIPALTCHFRMPARCRRHPRHRGLPQCRGCRGPRRCAGSMQWA
jgi:integrase